MVDFGSSGCMVMPDCKGLTLSYCSSLLILWPGDLAGKGKVTKVPRQTMCLRSDQICTKSSQYDHNSWVS